MSEILKKQPLHGSAVVDVARNQKAVSDVFAIVTGEDGDAVILPDTVDQVSGNRQRVFYALSGDAFEIEKIGIPDTPENSTHCRARSTADRKLRVNIAEGRGERVPHLGKNGRP